MVLSLPLFASANDVEVNGLYYDLVSKAKQAILVGYERGDISNPIRLGDVVIPSTIDVEGESYTVTSIGDKVFSGNVTLTSISLPKTIKSIGGDAFYRCDSIKAVYITDLESWLNIQFGDNVSNPLAMAHHLLLNGKELRSLIVPSTITKINDYAFDWCYSLESVIIPSNVKTIGIGAFSGCSNLKSIELSNGLSEVGMSAFSNCSKLKSIIIPNTVNSIGGQNTFQNCKSLESINLPEGIKTIGFGMFLGCESLTSIHVPNSVTEIGTTAFYGCKKLASVYLGENITTLESMSFANCPELTDLYCYSDKVPTINANSFGDSQINYATLHVPSTALNDYKSADVWNTFGSIVALKEKCMSPSISYNNGKLTFASETEGAECVTTINDNDVRTHTGNGIELTATYNISVYAMAENYENSDMVYATLCWIDSEPKTEGITNCVAQVKANAVLIQNNGGVITVTGVDDGTSVSAYSVSGQLIGNSKVSNNSATINTSLKRGETAILKIGRQGVKLLIR